DLGLLDDAEDPLLGGFDLREVAGRDLDHALVVDVHLGAGLGDDLADHLAARADDIADLRLVDGDRLDTRRVSGKLSTRGAQRLGHLAQDMSAAFLGLLQRLLHDFLGDAGHLDVHLQRGDALARAGHLEVHVAEVILVAKDVAEYGELVTFEDQAHRDARNGPRDRHARVHHRQTPTAHRRHRARAVGLGDVGENADRVRELFLARQHRTQRAPGQLAVADFAAPRGPEAAHFTDRIRREVVVQHEALVRQAGQPIDHLLAVLGAERSGADRLRFTAGEQRRTVRARQEADGRFDRADLSGRAAVDAGAVLEDRLADDVAFQLLHQLELAEVLGRIVMLERFVMLAGFGTRGVDGVLALL